MCLLESEVSHLCLEGTPFWTNLNKAREDCAAAVRGARGGSGGRYSKCKSVGTITQRWQTLFAEENCLLEKMGLRLNTTSPIDLEKYERATETIDTSLAALIHPNSTTMRRCSERTTSALTRKLIKCWGSYSEEEHSLLVKVAVGSAIANCFRVTLSQGCIGYLGMKLGREEVGRDIKQNVGMRDFSSQEIEEELFDKEMELEEKELQIFTIDEQQIA